MAEFVATMCTRTLLYSVANENTVLWIEYPFGAGALALLVRGIVGTLL